MDKSGRLSKEKAQRKRILGVIREWVTMLDSFSFISNPTIPGVINQPSYLIVPMLGKLIAIYIAWLPKKKINWPYVLALLEDLFEVKIHSGSTTSVGLILIDSDFHRESLDVYMRELLGNTYDFFTIYNESNILQNREIFLRELSEWFYQGEIKERFIDLWHHERSYSLENQYLIDKNLVNTLLKESVFGDWTIEQAVKEFENKLLDGLEPAYRLIKNPKVGNIKDWFINTNRGFHFSFDFEIRNHLSTLMQFTRGRESRFYLREFRSLATKARFLRYRINEELRVRPRQDDYRLYLLVLGHLRGPRYDPERYITTLVGSGWLPIRADLFSVSKVFE